MFVLFLVTFINILGFSMIIPLFPLFKIKFGFDNLQIGYVASIFALAGVFGSIFFGILSDKFGRKLPLVLPLIVVAIAYYFTGITDNSIVFIALRAVAGFFASNIAVAFAATSDISTPQNKFKRMGMMSSAFSLSLVIGPAFGGYMAGNTNDINLVNFSLPFDISAAMTLIAALLGALFFKETLTKESRQQITNTPKLLHQLTNLIKNPTVRFFTILTIIVFSVITGVQVFFGIWLQESFAFTPQHIGLVWAISGLVMAIIQFNISKIFTPKKALIIGLIIYGLSIATFTVAANAIYVIIASIFMTAGFALIGPSINSKLALEGEKNQQGFILGINQAMGSLGRIIGPNLIGALFFINHNFAWATISVISFLLALIVMKLMKPEKKNV